MWNAIGEDSSLVLTRAEAIGLYEVRVAVFGAEEDGAV